MSKNVIVIGAGGHGAVVADMITASGDTVLGFLDDTLKPGSKRLSFPVLGPICDYSKYDAEFVVAIGNTEARKRIVSSMDDVRWHTAIHPRASVSCLETVIGPGSVVMAGAIVNPGTKIGAHCILNTGSIVEHDCTVEDFAHISVGAKLGGTVHIGSCTWIGIGATVSNNIAICGSCTVGAGAVVVRSITEVGTYVGVPARKIK